MQAVFLASLFNIRDHYLMQIPYFTKMLPSHLFEQNFEKVLNQETISNYKSQKLLTLNYELHSSSKTSFERRSLLSSLVRYWAGTDH